MITTPRAVQAVAAGHSVARMALMVAVTVVMLVVSLTVWLVPTLGPPAAYTYLSVYVSEGAAPLQSNVVQFVQDDAVSCEYLSGGISSISQLKRRPMCDMRNSGGGYSEGRWLQSCQVCYFEYFRLVRFAPLPRTFFFKEIHSQKKDRFGSESVCRATAVCT